MSRLTLRLPETLHRQLEAQAKREGVSDASMESTLCHTMAEDKR